MNKLVAQNLIYGKGDEKTKRGKIINKSFGVLRKRNKKKIKLNQSSIKEKNKILN